MPIFISPNVSQWQLPSPAYRCYMLKIVRIGFMASLEMPFENVDDGRTDGRTNDGYLPILQAHLFIKHSAQVSW